MSEKPLMTLQESNALHHVKATGPRLNGIACPQCGKELIDSNPNMVLTTHPPMTRIACLHCEYSGTRTV